MEEKQINPLAVHFRHPILYVSLPSKGKWQVAGNITADPTNVPIMSMTSMDEIMLKTPEALLNSTATMEVIKSCIPSIVDPASVPTIDTDKLLIAIRIATYGHEMSIAAQCPHCKKVEDYSVDLRSVVDMIVMPDFSKTIVVNGCEVFFKPATYGETSQISYDQFNYEKTLQSLIQSGSNDKEQYQAITNQIRQAITRSLTINVEKIVTPEKIEVTSPVFINDFVSNIDKKYSELIKDHIASLRDQAAPPKFNIVCANEECGKDFTTSITFDLSHFFE